MISCSKIAYYLLCNHVGAVDGSARGRLFDVKDNKINAMGVDNVLFSVSNCEGKPPSLFDLSYDTLLVISYLTGLLFFLFLF